jgi:hypothetical protein
MLFLVLVTLPFAAHARDRAAAVSPPVVTDAAAAPRA